MPPYPAVAHLAFCFCCFVWGTSFILLERVTHVMGPVQIGIWRMLSGAAVVGACWWAKRDDYRMTGRDFALIAIASLLFTAPPQVIQAYVLEQGFGHGFFGTMVAAIPLMTIVVSVPMLGVRPTGRQLFGVLGGLGCIFLLVEDGVHRGMSVGLLALTMVIPLSSALSNTFYKWKLPHVPAAPLTTMMLLVSVVALLPLEAAPRSLIAYGIGSPAGASLSADAVTYLLLLGIVGSGISTMVYIWLVLTRGPLFAGMTTYVVPVIALLWGTLDHEVISSQQTLAIAGVLAMVALVQSKGAVVGGAKLPLGRELGTVERQAEQMPVAEVAAGELVSLPMRAVSLDDRRAVAAESQVA